MWRLICLACGVLLLAGACSEDVDEISAEEELFADFTSYAGVASEPVTLQDASDWLFEQMAQVALTNTAIGAILDLELEADVEVEYWRTSKDGDDEFRVTMETPDGTLRWAIIDYGNDSDNCCDRSLAKLRP